MKKQIILLGIVVLILLGCTACKSTSYLEKQSDLSSEDTSEDTTDSADTTEETEKKTEIYVQISGAVADPGVYTFPADSRVYELIEAAGGLLPEAYDVSLNQAERLSDGPEDPCLYQRGSGRGAGTDRGKFFDIGWQGQHQYGFHGGTDKFKGNRTDQGRKLVAYRQEHGAFAAVEDLKAVSGIGDATYQKIADAITVN